MEDGGRKQRQQKQRLRGSLSNEEAFWRCTVRV
jgi:hypothetical protein